MANEFFASGMAGVDRVSFDAGLRVHMQRVFNNMAAGLVITGLIAYVVANTALAAVIFGSPLKWLVMLAPLGFMLFLNFRMEAMSSTAVRTTFYAFCAAMGLSMASIFMVFTSESIARAFFVTAATFGAMSLWGYTTKKDLSNFGAFLMMGVVGLLIAGLINIFLQSSALQWVSSVAGVAIFTGLTAFDVQRIKQTYAESWGAEANEKLAVISALSLYMNFINAFQFLLQLMGTARGND